MRLSKIIEKYNVNTSNIKIKDIRVRKIAKEIFKNNISYDVDLCEKLEHEWIYKPIFKKLGLNFKHEFRLTKKLRPDFVIIINRKKIIVEVKKDNNKSKFKQQIKRYEHSGLYQIPNYLKTIVISKNGTHGMSLKEFIKKVKNNSL